jgi:CRISPR type III-A-associated RAMP protein Csm4
MQQAVLIRLRPRGPWRYGPSDGGHDRVDALYRSDRLYSALTLAMQKLGFLDEWLQSTAQASAPAVVFTSLFPYQGDTLFVPPPATLWPPPLGLVTTPSPVFLTKIRWNAARFVPLNLVESILAGQRILADQWIPDAESGCLLRRDRPSSSPYRVVTRSRAAVDRLSGSSVHVDASACVEWEAGSGLWTAARFADETAYSTWYSRVQSAFRLLADTGFGARRTSGWGQTAEPEFQTGSWPALLFPKLAAASSAGSARAGAESASDQPSLFWLLSLYSPSSSDAVDWRDGAYEASVRGGIVESASAGSGAEKKRVRMITEGSVLSAKQEPLGAAVDVAPDGFAHPVYRSGFALSLLLPELGALAQAGSEMDAILAEALRADESSSTPPETEPTEVQPEVVPEEPTADAVEPEAVKPPIEEMREPEAALREEPVPPPAEPESVAPVEESEAAEPAEAEPAAGEPSEDVPEEGKPTEDPNYEI